MEQREFEQQELEERDRGNNRYIVTIILIVANILLYMYTYIVPNDYYFSGGMNHECIVESGEYYRFFTSIFLHGDISHIAMNMLALAVAGSLVESYLGSLKTAIIYFVSGLGGDLLTIVIPDMTFSIGASGATFGLLVASAIIQNRKMGKSLIKAIGFVIVYAVLTWSEGIDLMGHIGGALAGAVATLFCMIGFREDYKEGRIGTCLGILLTILMSLVAAVYIIVLC